MRDRRPSVRRRLGLSRLQEMTKTDLDATLSAAVAHWVRSYNSATVVRSSVSGAGKRCLNVNASDVGP